GKTRPGPPTPRTGPGRWPDAEPVAGARSSLVHTHRWYTPIVGAHPSLVHTHRWCTPIVGAHPSLVHCAPQDKIHSVAQGIYWSLPRCFSVPCGMLLLSFRTTLAHDRRISEGGSIGFRVGCWGTISNSRATAHSCL